MKKYAAILLLMCCPLCAMAEESMVRIPASGDTVTGYIGCDVNASSCEKSDVSVVSVKAFMIDIHEATREEIKACYIAGDCKTSSEKHYNEVTNISDAEKNLPANVSHDIAVAYCESQGKRLPTEQEWLAVAMGDSVKDYVWGDEYERTAAAQYYRFEPTESVMSYPRDQSFGVYDLNGSLPEWIEGEKMGEYSPYCMDQRTCLMMGNPSFVLYQKIALECVAGYGVRCVKDL